MLQELKLLAIFLIILGIAMLYIGADAFTGGINWFAYNFGKFSFFAWLPTLLFGIGLYSDYKNKKRKSQR
ncbi:hypothetical protein [Mucilaginibacter sp.]